MSMRMLLSVQFMVVLVLFGAACIGTCTLLLCRVYNDVVQHRARIAELYAAREQRQVCMSLVILES